MNPERILPADGGEGFFGDGGRGTQSFIMVIFGGTGDLSRQKLLPALFHLYQEKELPQDFSILGLARSPMTDEEYRHLVKSSLQEAADVKWGEGKWEDFAPRLFYLPGDFVSERDFDRLCSKVEQVAPSARDKPGEVIYYLALPPQTVPAVAEKLKLHSRCQGNLNPKIIVEKPFGRDHASAAALNAILREAFREEQIYRIDHYLGKETVQNIIFFRFANSVFEEIWNRHFIDNIQITVAEDMGMENRGAFYEQTGVVRDIVQNHLLQLLATVAMEPPIGFAADLVRDEKLKVFRSIQRMDEEHVDRFMVRGQYGGGEIRGQEVPGYRQETRVSPHSNVPTFFAGKFYIPNWRWAGIPFYLRTGKGMAKRITEIAVVLNRLPLQLFGEASRGWEPNIVLLTIQPDEKISLRFLVKYPYTAHQVAPTRMEFSYEEAFGAKRHPVYERLLLDCLKGDLTLFVRQDAIEAMWEVVDPIIRRWEKIPPADFPNYRAGSWGPREAQQLVEQDGRRWITGSGK